MTEWRKAKIGELVTLRQGFAINSKSRHFVSKEPTSLALLRIADMKSGSKEVFIKEDIPQNFIATQKDIIYTRTGNVGLVFRNQTGVVHNNCFTVTPNNDLELSRTFLYYLLQNKSFYEKANLLARGAAQPDLPHASFNSIEVLYPSIKTQERIAEVLSRYDALIENYQRQIKLLEEAAQRLYKEWFVDLRFPGHQSTPIINNLPAGWQKKSVGECLIFHGNGGWGKDSPTGKNEYPGKVIRGTDIEDIKAGRYRDLPLRFHTDNDIKKRTLKRNDLVFELSNGNINNIGRCLLIDDIILKNTGDNTICASFCKLLRPIDRFHALMLYWEIQDMQISGRMLPLKKQGTNGINNFDFDGFLNHVLLMPSSESFLSPIEKITQKMGKIQGQLALLSEARDRLLPKLMRGEIEV